MDAISFEVSDELRELGTRAIDRVLADDSELADVAGGDQVFEATMAQLRSVLAQQRGNPK